MFINDFIHTPSRTGRRLALLIGVVLMGYFAYHLAFGNRGLARLDALKTELAQSERQHEAALAQRTAWEAKVAPLRDKSLDLDAVEERARDVLGYRREEEQVIFIPSEDFRDP